MILLPQPLARRPHESLERGGAHRRPLPPQALGEPSVRETFEHLPEYHFALELRTIARGRFPMGERASGDPTAVETPVEWDRELSDHRRSGWRELDLGPGVGPNAPKSVAVALATALGPQGHPAIGDQRIACETAVAGRGARPLALFRRNERPLAREPRGVVPHTGRNVRILVDLEASAELGRLLAETFDLRLLLLGTTDQLFELPLGDNDLIRRRIWSEKDRLHPSDHVPSGRGLTTSRTYNLGTTGIPAEVRSPGRKIPEGAKHVHELY
jgi:hypothetical protein